MLATDGLQPEPVRTDFPRVESRVLTFLLALVVFSSVFSAVATFEQHEDFILFDNLLKYVHIATVFSEVAFILSAVFLSRRMAFRRVVPDLPSKAELLAYAGLIFYIFAITIANRETAPFVETIWWIVHVLFFAALRLAWVYRLTVRYQFVWLALALAAVAHMAVFTAFVFSLPDPATFDWIGKIPGFTNIRHLADFIAPAIASFAAVALAGPKKYLLPLVLAFTLTLLYPSWTGGRGAFLAVLVGILTVLLFRKTRRPARMLALAGAVLVALLLPLLLPQTGPWPAILDRLEEYEIGTTTANQLSTNRLTLWNQTVQAIGDEPLFGHGPAQLAQVLDGARPEHHPHNIVLQILLQWGLVGLAISLAFIAVHARRIATAIAAGSLETIVSVAILATILAHSQIDGPLYYPFSFVLALIAFFNLWTIGAANDDAATETVSS